MQLTQRSQLRVLRQEKEGKKALCVSGGGAAGAYAVGLLKAWNRDYDLITGVSTGSLIAPLAALKEWEKLEKAYTNVNLDNVFNVSPFKKNGDVDWFRVARRIIGGKNSIGEMYPLRNFLIPTFYTAEDHRFLQHSNKDIFVLTTNIGLNYPATESFSIKNTEYETFCDALFGSCCFWPVSNIAMVNGFEHVDGGWTESLAIDIIMELGYKEIDVIMLRPKKVVVEVEKGYFRNVFKTFLKIFGAQRANAEYESLERACRVAAKDPEMNINVYYTPKVLSKNLMHFDKTEMQSWVRLGEQMAFDKSICESF